MVDTPYPHKLRTKCALSVIPNFPKTCFVIYNEDRTSAVGSCDTLFIFSSHKNADSLLTKGGYTNCNIVSYEWNELVEEFSKRIKDVVVDYSGEAGAYPHIPLQRSKY